MQIIVKKIVLVAAVALLLLSSNSFAFADTQFYLNLETDPSEVLIIDPNAVTGEGYYASGSWVVIDAEQTVTSGEAGAVRYEFVEWSTTDNSAANPEDVAELTGNQALLFMDGDRTVTAIYEPHYSFYLNLETDPSEVLIIDPNAVTGEGYYASGTCVIIDAKQTVTSGAVRYEFVEWSSYDPWVGDPEEEPVLTETQAFAFMDGDRTVTAIYEEMFVGEWEYGYEDESSGFMLRISTDDKYFQFITTEKTFSITKADIMIVRKHLTIISHSDDEIRLFSISLNSNIDYCLTYARDMQTGQRYLLIDRIGIE